MNFIHRKYTASGFLFQTFEGVPTKNQIIEELYRSKDFNECIRKMQPEHLQDDLRSEVMLVLLETNEEKLRGMYERGELRYYTVRIILNLANSKTSPFFIKYRRFSEMVYSNEVEWDRMDLSEDINQRTEKIVSRELRELKEESALQAIESLPWYEREIINLYRELGSYRKIEEATYVEAMGTGIPWESCYSTVQKAFKKIRHAINHTNIILWFITGFLLG